MRALISALTILVLAGCTTAQAPLEVKSSPMKAGSVSDLELATAQLREQHEAMSETLTWMEGEVTALKAGATLKPAANAPRMTSAAEEPTALSKLDGAPAPIAAPVPAEVTGLTDQDLKADANIPAAPAPRIHIASYLEKKQALPGWTKLQAQYGKLLEGLSPTTEVFKDNKGQLWHRLYAGPFASAQAASERCAELKAVGGWCE